MGRRSKLRQEVREANLVVPVRVSMKLIQQAQEKAQDRGRIAKALGMAALGPFIAMPPSDSTDRVATRMEKFRHFLKRLVGRA